MKKLLFLLALLSAAIQAQVNWTPYANNPVIPPTYDSSAYGPCVLYDGTIYRMWYTRQTPPKEKIGYATSVDGLAWTYVDSLVLVTSNDPNRFDYKKAGQPTVIKDVGDTLKMWYWGGNSGQTIGYAWSMDGQNWTKVDGPASQKSVLDATIDGSGAAALATPCVVKDGNTYHMWYSRLTIAGGLKIRLGHATSPNGINWTNVPGPGLNGAAVDITPGSFDENAAYYPSVIKNGNLFQMWYAGSDDNALSGGWRIGYATSPDGSTWTKVAGPHAKSCVIDSSVAPSVMLTGNTYRMWYNGALVNYATSQVTGINEFSGDDRLLAYPNPSTGRFTVMTLAKNYRLCVYNSLGEKILEQENKAEIDLSKAGSGIYLLQISSNGKVSTGRLVVE